MIDDEDIRKMLEARASAATRSPKPGLVDRARAIAVGQPRGATGWHRLAVALATGIAGVGVVAVIAVSLARPTAAPEAGPSFAAAPSPTVSAGPTATEPTIEPWDALTWYSGDDGRFEQVGRKLFIQAVAPWHGAWIAVGSALDLATGRVSGVVIRSDDGRTWDRDPERPDEQFDRLIVAGDYIVIVGSHRQPDIGDQQGPTVPTMWRSTDGREWTEAPLPADFDIGTYLANVAVGGRGWLLRASTIQGGVRWLVGDPVSGWSDLTPDEGAFTDVDVNDIVGTDDGWMAMGMTGADVGSDVGLPFGDPKNDRGAIWWSPDGVTWTPARIADPGTSVSAIHRVAEGWIATGYDHRGCPRCIGGRSLAWRSDDGRSWTPLEVSTSLKDVLGWGRFASDGQRGLLFDRDDAGRLRARETRDGLEWSDIAVFIEPAGAATGPGVDGVLGVGSDAVVVFFDPSTESLDRFWMVPQVAIAGEPPPGAATQSPGPPPENHDVVCPEPAGEPCGP